MNILIEKSGESYKLSPEMFYPAGISLGLADLKSGQILKF